MILCIVWAKEGLGIAGRFGLEGHRLQFEIILIAGQRRLKGAINSCFGQNGYFPFRSQRSHMPTKSSAERMKVAFSLGSIPLTSQARRYSGQRP